MRTLVIWSFAFLSILSPLSAQPLKTAVFPFEMTIEMQMGDLWEPEASKNEKARLKLLTDKLRELLTQSGKYEIVDIAPLAEKIEKKAPLHKCKGCDSDLAKELGAQRSVIGKVHKSSATLLNVSIFVRDTSTGELTKTMAVSVRQNTDLGWLRGVKYLVRTRFLAEGNK